jgi:dTDP-4-dehydrorhamnose reductase
MRVLVLGGEGMLGHKVVQELGARFDTFATVRTSAAACAACGLIDRQRVIEKVDAFDDDSVTCAFGLVRPDVVVNCIGLIKQVPAAHDPVAAISLNALFPHKLAVLCRAAGARLIHISTDCVFSGRKGMYLETDQPDAEDLYGKSKELGEVSGEMCLTLRTSIIGREIETGHALVEWFLGRAGGCAEGYTTAIFSGVTTKVLAARHRRCAAAPSGPRGALPRGVAAGDQIRPAVPAQRGFRRRGSHLAVRRGESRSKPGRPAIRGRYRHHDSRLAVDGEGDGGRRDAVPPVALGSAARPRRGLRDPSLSPRDAAGSLSRTPACTN